MNDSRCQFRIGSRPATAAMVFAVAVVLVNLVGCQSSPDTTDEPMVTDYDDQELPPEQQQQQQQPQIEDAPGDWGDDTGIPSSDETGIPSQDPAMEAEPPDASSAPAPPQNAPAGAEAPSAMEDEEQSEAPVDVTEAQVKQFAAAYVDVMDIQFEFEPRFESASDSDERTALQQQLETESIEAIEAHQMSADEFNTIADLLTRDRTLRDRVQAEVDAIAH